MRHVPLSVLCVLASLTWSSTLEAQSTRLFGVPGSSEIPPQPGGAEVATLALPGGARVQFVSLQEGRVGVAETAPAGVPLRTDLLVRRWNASPLELFMALAPGAHVPEALRVDHAASSSKPARVLTLPPLHGVPIDLFDCDPVQNFEDDWYDTYTGVTKVVVAESYVPFEASSFYWYPAARAYYGTNLNLSTHFGICAGDRDASYTVQIQRRVPGPSWVHSVTAVIGYNARFTFHANVPAIYRMRLSASDDISQLAAGAAYTPAPPEAGTP